MLTEHDRSLRDAAKNGDTLEVCRLIPLSSFYEPALEAAIIAGHKECVEMLIPVCTHLKENIALYSALIHDQYDIFKLLLPHSNPKSSNSNILFECSRRDLFEYVTLLVPFCDVSAQNSIALVHASMHKNQQMFDLFYPHCDAKQALKEMKRFQINNDEKRMLKEAVRTENERELLHQSTSSASAPNSRVKKI